MSLNSGLLTNSGNTTITVTAEDSRGRTAAKTTTITVAAYQSPTATLDVWRVDADGNTDPIGDYARYAVTYSYTQVAGNTLQAVTLTSGQDTANVAAATGDILPGSRKSFNIQNEYDIQLTVRDSFETVTVTKKLPSGRFIIFANADGNRLAFMRATDGSKTIPQGKDSIIEFSGNSQIYIGDRTLEQYIRYVMNNS